MTRKNLKSLLASEDTVFAPGAWDGLSALLIQDAGFKALTSSGFAVSASLGMPDAELYTMTENLEAVRRMAYVTDIPIIADIDTGYGNAVNVMRTVREFEAAGAAAIFMEDQLAPKRCPICVGDPLPVIPRAEAVGKIKAAVDARRNSDTIIIARCDSHGADAMERTIAYAEAGADMIMPVTKTFDTIEQFKACHDATGLPLVLSLTPSTWVERDFTPEQLKYVGCKIALLPLQVLYAGITGMRKTLTDLAANPYAPASTADHIRHHDFVKVIGFPEIEELQTKYMPATLEEPATAG
jgi:methylisocitrate lyase